MEYFRRNCENCEFCVNEHCINTEAVDYNEPVNEYMICLKWQERTETKVGG